MSESAPGSAGALLRAAREQRGLHIAALAAAIKVAPRKLDALENDRWDELPDATFTRALAQTVCRTLKIDAGPVLERLPPAAAAPLEGSGAGLNMPFRDRPGREIPGLSGAAIRPMVWAAGLLMVAALALYFVPSGLWTPRAAPAVLESSAAPSTAPAATSVPASVALPTITPQAASAPAESAASTPAVAGSMPALPPVPASATVDAPPRPLAVALAPAASAGPAAPTPTPARSEAGSDAAAAGSVVQLHVRGPSWVEAKDAKGQVLLSRLLQPGERLGLDGALPIRLVIGDATVTQVQFRGQPVDLAPSTRNNVARLQVP